MGLRGKLRKTFSSKKIPTIDSMSITGEQFYTDRTDIEYYKPNEIPRSKYRGKVDPEHQASLAAFSLADAFAGAGRRSSLALSGSFSPGGTNAQSKAGSRAASIELSRRPSRQDQPRSNLRMESHMSDGSGSTSREKSISASTALDVDTASMSLSDQTTAVPSAPTELNVNTKLTQHDSGIDMPDLVLSKHSSAHDTPFTLEELEQAMSRASLHRRDFGLETERRHAEVS
jgi:hypothetical protein